MIRLDVVQGSEEWIAARLGIPTASAYDRIIQPKKLGISAGAVGYRAELLAERLTGYPVGVDVAGSRWAERGHDMEAEARAWLEMEEDVTVETVGFVLRDDGRTGGSPDGLIGDDDGAELKVPALHTHIAYLLDPDSLAEKYAHQVQGYLYLTSRPRWRLLSYNPELPKVRLTVERDERFIAALAKALDQFCDELEAAWAKLEQYKGADVAEARRVLAEHANA